MHGATLQGLRVLVLEDEVLIALDLEQMCRDFGAKEVTVVRDLESIPPDALSGGLIDVVVLDIMLAGHSTIDFAAKLMERVIPFVVTTGYSDAEGLLAGLSGVEIVEKPYSSEALVGALAKAVKRRSVAI